MLKIRCSADNSIHLPDMHQCPYFLLKSSLFGICFIAVVSCGRYHYAAPQYSDLPGDHAVVLRNVDNMRFLGGIKNSEGKMLKDSIFFRSANLHHLKKKSMAAFGALGITKIIDLRTPHEIEEKPDYLPPGVDFEQLAAFSDREDQLAQARSLVLKGKVTRKDAEKRMLEFYRDYPVEHPEVIRRIVHEILDADQPVLYHCTAGKDRTGIISMLILKILKFDDHTILQEYLMSNNQRQKIIEKRLNLAHHLHVLYPKLDIGVLEELSWIRKEYLDETYLSINRKYGSMENYIRKILGISEEQQETYIRKFMY